MKKLLYSFLITSLAGLSSILADVVVTGDPTTGTGVFTLTEDITFTMSKEIMAGGSLFLIFDEWVTTADSATLGGVNIPPSFFFNINGGSDIEHTNATNIYDNWGSSFGDFTPNDGALWFTGAPAIGLGDTFTIRSGSWTLPSIADFNPELASGYTFSGDTYLADFTFLTVSNTVAIPELSSVLSMLIAISTGAGVFFIRRSSPFLFA